MSDWHHRYRRQFAVLAVQGVREDAAFYGLILAYTCVGMILMTATGIWDRAAYSIYFGRWLTTFAFFFPTLAVLLSYAVVAHRFDKRRSLALKRMFSAPRMARLVAGTCLLIALVFFQATFTSIKNALPVWQGGFLHDALQADIDRWLHFGTDPWRFLFAFGESPLLRRIVEWNYNILWFVISFGALFIVTTSPRMAEIRSRYLLCFMLVWIVCGNVLAGLFLSAGPAFYAEVTGDAVRFAEQLAFLAGGAGESNSAASYQSYLWALHESGQPGFGSGISAFPSVHVGLIAMIVFFLHERSRRLACAGYAYLALILASSVYLGWHYAVDGYVSIAVVLAIHLVVRRFASRAVLPGEPHPVGSVIDARVSSAPLP